MRFKCIEKYKDGHWNNEVNHTEINMCQGEEIKLLCISVSQNVNNIKCVERIRFDNLHYKK